MRFAAGEYILLLLLVPLLALIYWGARRRTLRALSRIADNELGQSLLGRFSDKKAILKAALVFGAMIFIVAALTRPQLGGRSTLVKKEGIDLLFAVDISRSMAVRDIRPNRLKRAKLELQSLIDQLSGDRVGIISFAGVAFVQCPLTTDYASARMFLKSLSTGDAPVQGTAIGPALQLSHKLLTGEQGNSGSRLVVLLTDGEDHGEALDEAVKQLTEARIPIFVVGIGSSSGEPIPDFGENGEMTGYHKNKGGQTVMSRLDEGVLRRIARQTDGRYISLQAGGSLDELREFVGRMQKQEFESSLYTQYDEKYAWLLWPGFLLLLLASLIDERKGSRWLGLR